MQGGLVRLDRVAWQRGRVVYLQCVRVGLMSGLDRSSRYRVLQMYGEYRRTMSAVTANSYFFKRERKRRQTSYDGEQSGVDVYTTQLAWQPPVHCSMLVHTQCGALASHWLRSTFY